LKSKNGFVPGIKVKAVLADIGATVVDPKKEEPKNLLMSTICIRFGG
jgi:hypothetical protein